MNTEEFENIIKREVKKHIENMNNYDTSNITKIKKIKYLSKYLKAKEKYLLLDNQSEGVHSVDLNYVKSTTHKSLAEKIYKRDLAFDKMINAYIEISNIILTLPFWYQPLMHNAFIKGYSLKELAQKSNSTESEIKDGLNYCINFLK